MEIMFLAIFVFAVAFRAWPELCMEIIKDTWTLTIKGSLVRFTFILTSILILI